MKIYFVCILALGFHGFSQSKDDIPDTRRKTESFIRVPEKEIKADLAYFTMAGIDESVGKGEIAKVPFTSVGTDSMEFTGLNMRAIVKTAKFEPSKHKLIYDEKYLTRIDKKTYYGNYGQLPVKYISKVLVMIGKDTVNIPASSYADLYNLNLSYSDKGKQRSTNGIYLSKDKHTIYFYLFSKDSSGSYEVTWIIRDKKFVRRVLDYGFM